ncbi:hypothetical protein DSO57_1006634 [Entomophthora muscae]|uniref:Uncharacterized protein n=1 Tax=Entomophthora muscae TaxID=34485 RepID=A0ACC2U5J9_9FUNG|nr:hypothetical protein DSO57_1006634 [Entomophthora muscae]
MKLSWLLAAVTAEDLTERLGFNPALIVNTPPGTVESVAKYLQPGVLYQFASQLKSNPPSRLHKPGKQVPLTKKELMDSFEMGYLSFCPGKRVVDFDCICSKEYTDVVEVEDPITQASVIIAAFPKRRTIAVSYSFTRSVRNWLTNVDAILVQMENAPEGVKLHLGFYKHYLSIHNQTMAAVSNLLQTKYKGYDIFASGYSLGACIAVVAAPFWHEFKKTHDTKVQIVSYSGPRTGNLASKLYFESLSVPITRYSNQDDIVTMLPPRSLDYVHTGVEVYEYATQIPNKTNIVACSQDYDEDPNCQWRERYRPTILRHPFPFNAMVPLPPFCNAPPKST